MQVNLCYAFHFKLLSRSCMLVLPRVALQQKEDGYIVTVSCKLSECRHGDDDLENLPRLPRDAVCPILDTRAQGYIINELGH